MMDDANERIGAESEDHMDHDETEQMDQALRLKIIALSGTVVEEAGLRSSIPRRNRAEMTMPVCF